MKVSIIIPVFNMEKYLETCLNSVVLQTYRNLEILLIDDGSIDNSRIICEKFQAQDERINYFRQANLGVSSARNIGIDHATGEFIYFLDSDDFIPLYTIETLIEELKMSNSDIVSTSYKYVSEAADLNCEIAKKDFSFFQDGKSCIYRQKVSNHPWGKLYRKTLFEEVRYPVGRNYEDISTTHILFSRAKKISYTHSKLYFYRMRQNAITYTFTKKNIHDLIYAYFCVKKYYMEKETLDTNYYLLTILYTCFSRLMRVPWKNDADYIEYKKLIRQEFDAIWKKTKMSVFLKETMSLKLYLYKLNIAELIFDIKEIVS